MESTATQQAAVDCPETQDVEGTATARDLVAKLKAQSGRCNLSGIELTPSTVEIDHIIPASEGGTEVPSNLQLLDARVNRMKGVLSQQEFIDICCKVAQWTEGKAETHQ